jgi:hypothetical protein
MEEKSHNSTSEPRNPIPIFIVSCSQDEKSPENEGQITMISQITTMIKTINFFSTRNIDIHLITNKFWVFDEVNKRVKALENIGNIK